MSFTVERRKSKKLVQMSTGLGRFRQTWTEPEIKIIVKRNGKKIAELTNGSMLALPEGPLSVTKATDEQIIRAITYDGIGI